VITERERESREHGEPCGSAEAIAAWANEDGGDQAVHGGD